jgi:hypothetical protein
MRSIGSRLAALATIGLVASVLPRAGLAAQEMVVTDVDALSQDVRVYVAKTGGEVMKHIQEAQRLTATTTDLTGAYREAGKALALVHSVEQASPTHKLHHAIGELLHKHRTGTAKPDDYLPVMGVLNDVKEIQGVDVAAVKTSLERAKGKLQSGAKVEAEADLVDAYEGVGYLEFDLPVKATEARLVAARIALLQNDKNNANAALSDAINNTKTWTAMAQGEAVEADVKE